MNQVALTVEGLGKEYRIGGPRERYRTLRHTVREAVAAPIRRARGVLAGHAAVEHGESIWALKDLSFEIRAGEVVGIIGRNGAGKSTLLKILSRITEPTVGRARIYGRVGSLLEVGTGFHPELTGRENVFLNGAILGMRKAEIERKFDEIVAFAEVEKFIDTPVKHYSSGMYLRLAFAVAAHLEPEILVIDEVLAVGDAGFQRKCLSKMEDVGDGGRTVLFVSHNMPAVARLCDRTILLDGGRLLEDGPSHQVVATYLSTGLGTTAVREWATLEDAPGNDIARLRAVRVRTEAGTVSEVIDIRRSIGVELEFEVMAAGYPLLPHFYLINQEGVKLFTSFNLDPAWRGVIWPPGRYRSTGWIPGNFLAEGTMIVGVALRSIEPHMLHFHERDAVAFQVVDAVGGDTARGDWTRDIPGVVRPLLRWTTDHESAAGRHPAPALQVAASAE